MKGNTMLANILQKYLKNTPFYTKLLFLYNRNLEFCDYHDFFSNDIKRDSLKRGLSFINNIINLQLILNNKLYFPGIGLFTVEPANFIKGYSFPETFENNIQINDKLKYKDENFILNIIIDGKINYKVLDEKTIQVRNLKNPNKFTLYSKIETKIKYINGRILKESGLKKDQLRIVLKEPYKGGASFEEIKMEYEKNKEFGFHKYLENIYMDNIVYEPAILEDIVLLIGYIENNIDNLIGTNK